MSIPKPFIQTDADVTDWNSNRPVLHLLGADHPLTIGDGPTARTMALDTKLAELGFRRTDLLREIDTSTRSVNVVDVASWGPARPVTVVNDFRMPALAVIDDMHAETLPGFVYEQWTTCSIGHLERGTVISLPGKAHRPAAIVATKALPGADGATVGRTEGVVADIDSGERTTFELPANKSVLTRCDIAYVADS